jgi:hypothetical protein
MIHAKEIDSIIAQVTPWPEEDRVALAYRLLREARGRTRQPAPRNTLTRALGLAAGTSPPPDDATVDRWIEEHRLQKHG